jgi:hypothetical protein
MAFALLGALPLAELLRTAETVARAGTSDLHLVAAEIEAEYRQVIASLEQLRLRC